jgi:thymidylate synthase (FAD)
MLAGETRKKKMSEVKLAGFTRAVEGGSVTNNLIDLVAYYARVSNPTSQISALNNEKLIKYLIKHKHWSPFEMVNICLDIVTTRDISHQIIRHRTFSFQEFSQRYSATEVVNEIRETRLQDNTNRQNSLQNDNEVLDKWWIGQQSDVMDTAYKLYDAALKKGIAKEQARVILPEGLTRTRLYMNGSLRSWIHYIELRTDPATQKEHRIVAQQCAEAIEVIFPMIVNFKWDDQDAEA